VVAPISSDFIPFYQLSDPQSAIFYNKGLWRILRTQEPLMASASQQDGVFPQNNDSSVRKKDKTLNFNQIEAPQSASAAAPYAKNRCKQRYRSSVWDGV
jgi:hypothetical protein